MLEPVPSTMATREDVILAAAATVILCGQKKQRPNRRRFWVCPSLRPKQNGQRHNIIDNLMADDVGLLPAQIGDSSF